MLKISSAVADIVESSEVARSALAGGYLNLNAYARSIRKSVEKITKKSVKIGTIVVALSRFGRAIKKEIPLVPDVVIDTLSIRSGLAALVFNKTSENLTTLRRLYQDERLRASDFLAVSQGTGEITIITVGDAVSSIRNLFNRQKPKVIIRSLSGLTVRFADEYANVPNIFYSFLRSLAIKRINIVEIISTYTELTFVINERDLEVAFRTLNKEFKRKISP